MVRSLNTLISLGLLLIALAILAYRSLRFGGYFPDDAYITFRFGQHLSEGHGIVWNIGGPPTEGSTSFLMTLLTAGAYRAGLDTDTASYLISALTLLGILGVFVGIARQLTGRFDWDWALALALFLTGVHFNVHLIAGMETMLAGLLLLASFLAALRLFDRPSTRAALMLALVNFLCLWCRPDSAVFLAGQGAVLGIAALVMLRQGEAALFRTICVSFGVLLIAGLAFLGWKLSYFGYILPNSFYVKSSGPSDMAGLEPVLEFLVDMAGRLALAFPFLLFVDPRAVWARVTWTGVARVLLLVLPVFGFLAMNLTVQHVVNYNYRFEYPIAGFFWVALGWVLANGNALERLRGLVARFLPPVLAMSVAAAMAALAVFGTAVADRKHHRAWFAFVQKLHYEPFAAALIRAEAGPETTLVYDAAGYIPFTSRVSFLDPVGLTENALSGRDDLTPEEREIYMWSSNPDVYLGPFIPASPGATGPEDDPVMQSRFVQEILLNEDTFEDYGNSIQDLDDAERSALVHFRMRELRDNWRILGEYPYPHAEPPQYTHFVYVRPGAEREEALVRELSRLVTRSYYDIDLEDIPNGQVTYTYEMAEELARLP